MNWVENVDGILCRITVKLVWPGVMGSSNKPSHKNVYVFYFSESNCDLFNSRYLHPTKYAQTSKSFDLTFKYNDFQTLLCLNILTTHKFGSGLPYF